MIVLFGALLPHRTYKPWGGRRRTHPIFYYSTYIPWAQLFSLYPCVCLLSGAPFPCGEERTAYRQDRLCDGSGKCALAVRTPLSASSARPLPSPVAPSVPVGCLANEKTRNPSHISTETHTHTHTEQRHRLYGVRKGKDTTKRKEELVSVAGAGSIRFSFSFFFLLLSRIPSIIESPERMQRERDRQEGEKSWKEESGFSSIYY